MSRLWGEWTTAFYPSGTTIVVLKDPARRPHLYIYADVAVSEDRNDLDRMTMCNQLAQFLNGLPRPLWLNDLERRTETYAVSLAGANITTVGPMVDADPPNCNWRQDESEDAKSDRAKLMDALFLPSALSASSAAKTPILK